MADDDPALSLAMALSGCAECGCAFDERGGEGRCECGCHRPPPSVPQFAQDRIDGLLTANVGLHAENQRLVNAIRTHRDKVTLLGYRLDDTTRKPIWGGQFDRDLWAVLGEGYPSQSDSPMGDIGPSESDDPGRA